MFRLNLIAALLLVVFAAGSIALTHSSPDSLRNVRKGQTFPEFDLQTDSGEHITNDRLSGNVTVLVYVVADQPSSEQAILDASTLAGKFENKQVDLVFVTAYQDRKPYFEQMWEAQSIKAPLVYDPDRRFSRTLGLVAFPTTIVIDAEGKLAHAMAIRGLDYTHTLEGFIRHTLGELNDQALDEFLRNRDRPEASRESKAARHRAVARSLREKGMFEAAKKELEQARTIDEGNSDILLDLADLNLRMSKIEDAAELVTSVLKSSARNQRAMRLQGYILFKTGKLDEAHALLTSLLPLDPNPTRTLYYLGRIEQARGNTKQALDHYRTALERVLDEPHEPNAKPAPANPDSTPPSDD